METAGQYPRKTSVGSEVCNLSVRHLKQVELQKSHALRGKEKENGFRVP